MKSGNDIYSKDGVNVHEGDQLSSYAGSICKNSYENSSFVDIHDISAGHFRGPRTFSFKNLPEGYTIDAAPDGIGTKVVMIDAAMTHRDASRDVMAMTGGDIVRFGGLPLVFINVLDVATLGQEGDKTNTQFREMITGLGEAAKEQNIVVLKGETAELGACIGSENENATTKFNWAGMMIGVYHPDKMITGSTLASGQKIIALREHGFRSNGSSSTRKAFAMKYGKDWWSNPDAADDIQKAAVPSILYARFLATMNGWYTDDFKAELTAHAVIHITGGGIPSKLGEDILFPRGLSGKLDNLWEPSEIMKNCAQWRGASDEECYRTWNGGQGMLVVVDEVDTERCITMAKEFNIEAQVAGTITKEDTPKLEIVSQFSGNTITITSS